MRKVALSLMLAASMAATTLGSTAVFASDATTTESESYTYRYALADFPTNWSLHDNQTCLLYTSGITATEYKRIRLCKKYQDSVVKRDA